MFQGVPYLEVSLRISTQRIIATGQYGTVLFPYIARGSSYSWEWSGDWYEDDRHQSKHVLQSCGLGIPHSCLPTQLHIHTHTRERKNMFFPELYKPPTPPHVFYITSIETCQYILSSTKLSMGLIHRRTRLQHWRANCISYTDYDVLHGNRR